MRQPQTHTTWKVTCRTAEDAQALQQWLSSHIDPDRVFTDTVTVAPNGAEQTQIVRHRLGDYFSEIRMLPDFSGKPVSFGLTFHRRPDAGGFWKDLMVNILQEIEANRENASIELESKGEMAPAQP